MHQFNPLSSVRSSSMPWSVAKEKKKRDWLTVFRTLAISTQLPFKISSDFYVVISVTTWTSFQLSTLLIWFLFPLTNQLHRIPLTFRSGIYGALLGNKCDNSIFLKKSHGQTFREITKKYVSLYISESESCSVVSDSLQPHGLYSPWNSPGHNTGVGSLSLLWGIFPTQR